MIPFNRAPLIGTEEGYIAVAAKASNLCGNGAFTQRCQKYIQNLMGGSPVFMTTSCTSSLELAAILTNIQPGEEVILPSFTFVSSVNAFVLRGAIPVMVDIEPNHMDIDYTKFEAAITPKTRVIVPVHYGGVACNMDAIMAIAEKHNLIVVEDAAPSLAATYKNKALGSIGHMGCFSFHETKNFTAGGQGGAIVINDPKFLARAEIVYDNGTNRWQFFRGEIRSYEWVDIGSNFVMSEIQAAYLWAQLEVADQITARRRQLCGAYDAALRPLAESGQIRLFDNLPGREHNGHVFFIKLQSTELRDDLQKHLKEKGITASPHYVPLHPRDIFGKLGRFVGKDVFTTAESDVMLRLPLFFGLSDSEQNVVITHVRRFLHGVTSAKIHDGVSVKESVDGEGVAGNSVAKDVLWKRVNGQGGHVVMS